MFLNRFTRFEDIYNNIDSSCQNLTVSSILVGDYSQSDNDG